MATNTANATPIFTNTGNFFPVRITGGNIFSDGQGAAGTSLFQLVIAGTDGTRVDGVRFRNLGTGGTSASTSNVHRIFLSGSSGSSNLRLVGEVAVTGGTRNSTTIGVTSIFTFDQPIIMKNGQILWVSQSTYVGDQDRYDALAYASDY